MTDNDKQTADQSGTGRWLRGVLFVSLALNLAVAGMVIGHALGGGPPDRRDRRAGDDPVIPYTRALDEDQRRMLGRTLRDSFKRQRDGGDYRFALEVLREEPFDAEKMTSVLQAQGARAEARRSTGQAALTHFLSNLSPKERHAYADRLERQIEQMEERRARRRD